MISCLPPTLQAFFLFFFFFFKKKTKNTVANLSLLSRLVEGTGWNIEAMSEFVNVPEFFSSVYLVDFSPSLCEVARKRFRPPRLAEREGGLQRCEKFRLEDYESDLSGDRTPNRSPASYFNQKRPEHGGADLVTMSYSLSMIVSSVLRPAS